MACPQFFLHPNGQQEVDDVHEDKIPDDPKNPAVITLDIYDIKPMPLLNICQKTKVLKNP